MGVGAALALSLLLPATAPATHLTYSASRSEHAVPWGFNEAWGFERGVWSAATTSRHLDLTRQIIPEGLSANRFHVNWDQVERRRGSYRWRRSDQIYALMRERGDLPVMMIYNAPRWAREPGAACPSWLACAYPPRHRLVRAWGRFVGEAIARYPEVRAVEVWNEPNLGRFWAPRPKVSRYVELLAAAHAAVAAAGSGVPVIVGGVTPATSSRTTLSAAEFMRRVYTQGCDCDFEGIGSHPYPRRSPHPEQMTNWLDKLRAVRDSNNDGATPLWITEVGISTDPVTGVSLEQQGMLVELYRSVLGHDVAAFIVHRLQDISYEGSFWSETGVVEQDLTPKPAYCSLAAGIGTGSGGCE